MLRNTSDALIRWGRHPIGSNVLRTMGIPVPPTLERPSVNEYFQADTPLDGRRVAVIEPSSKMTSTTTSTHDIKSLLYAGGAQVISDTSASKCDGVIINATMPVIDNVVDDSCTIFQAFQNAQRLRSKRILVLGDDDTVTSTQQQDLKTKICSGGLNGLVRSFAKEVGPRGTSVNMLRMKNAGILKGVTSDTTDHTLCLNQPHSLLGPMSFFLLPDSAFVSGQIVYIGNDHSLHYNSDTPINTARKNSSSKVHTGQSLFNKVALVTGAANGIGRAISMRLANEGAFVICLDLPSEKSSLEQLVSQLDGAALTMDLRDENSAKQLAENIRASFDGVDIVVHNAGITRDKTLAKLDTERITSVLDVNLASILRVDEALGLHKKESTGTRLVRPNGRVIYLSSVNGIAGAFGQTNYSFTKAALIKMASANANILSSSGITVNAIAPGFIETSMTEKMPLIPRQIGRRTSAFQQGGLPEDVAAAIAMLSLPASAGINGQTIRVCGGNIVGM